MTQEAAPPATTSEPDVAGEAATEPADEVAEPPDTDAGGAPSVRVHEERLGRRVAPMELSPTEALRLAREGRRSLVRRELPPDEVPGGSEDRDAE